MAAAEVDSPLLHDARIVRSLPPKFPGPFRQLRKRLRQPAIERRKRYAFAVRQFDEKRVVHRHVRLQRPQQRAMP